MSLLLWNNNIEREDKMSLFKRETVALDLTSLDSAGNVVTSKRTGLDKKSTRKWALMMLEKVALENDGLIIHGSEKEHVLNRKVIMKGTHGEKILFMVHLYSDDIKAPPALVSPETAKMC